MKNFTQTPKGGPLKVKLKVKNNNNNLELVSLFSYHRPFTVTTYIL